jgi:polyhydroxybutyrate depolymerase
VTSRLLGTTLAVMMMLVSVQVQRVDGQDRMTWKVDGAIREAIVYQPSLRSARSGPLVLSFHGRGDDMENFQHTDMHRAWPEAVVAYFQGLSPGRDSLSGWQVEKGQNGDRDLKLVDAAIASLRQKYRVDDTRIYATGFSNGAGFTYLLWAERPTVFAAFAPVSARLRSSVQPKQPRPLFHVAGTQDATIPFAEQKAAIDTAKRVNGVTAEGTSCGNGCTIDSSASAAPVMTWIHAGGHEYPAITSERIAKFFREHPLTR